MTAAALLESLTARGVQLLPDPSAPSGLRYRAPLGVVNAQVAQSIRLAAPPLLALLDAQAAGHITRPIAQSALPGAPARFASTLTPRKQREDTAGAPGEAQGYPGPEAGPEAIHRWALREWERLRGGALLPGIVAGALAAYELAAYGAEAGGDDTQEGETPEQDSPGAVPLWLRACAPPPRWSAQEERAHGRLWQEQRAKEERERGSMETA